MDTLRIELPPQPTQAASNLRRWVEVMNNPELCKIEGRIETDRHGHHFGRLFGGAKLVFTRYSRSIAPFPLTPALSLGERGPRTPPPEHS
jgi:hypothetical protein